MLYLHSNQTYITTVVTEQLFAVMWCSTVILKIANKFVHTVESSCSQAFAKMFKSTPDDLDMHVIYDVSHNIAKVEEHFVDGKQKTLLVHRKGSTRAFPPHHPLIPVDYQVNSVLG